jgi:hypothetical protein
VLATARGFESDPVAGALHRRGTKKRCIVWKMPVSLTTTCDKFEEEVPSEADQGNDPRAQAQGSGHRADDACRRTGISASALCKMEKGQREHDWARFDTAHEMIERLERGEPVPVREEASDE